MGTIVDRSADIGPFIPEPDDNMIICRCEEITKGEIRQAIHDGMYTMTEIKRFTRAGMGLCQGGTCANIIKRILAKELHMPPGDIEDGTSRSPVRPAEIRQICKPEGSE